MRMLNVGQKGLIDRSRSGVAGMRESPSPNVSLRST